MNSRSEEPQYLQNLNPPQREAVLHTQGPLIVLAGAGSGKTKMLTSRITHLIEACDTPPYQVLAVTFTNKAAEEMRNRVTHHLSQSSGKLITSSPEIGTFHRVCLRILRTELKFLPYTGPFVIYDEDDQQSLIKSILRKLNIDEKKFTPRFMQQEINRLKCDATEPQELDPSPHNIPERQLKLVFTEYQKELFSSNAIDFGEILCLTYRLLRDHEEVRTRYQQRFRFIHVDEYQDTNRVQYLLLTQLARSSFGGNENICVVGDEDQSIYRWRGADIRNILEFEKDYPGAMTVKLEQNYRSTKTIIGAASELIKNNTQRKPKTLWTEKEQGAKIIHWQLPDDRAEAEITIREIKKLHESGGHGFNDFAIFYRTNAQSRSFEDSIRREKIPYQIIGGLRFYDRKEIKDTLAYFKVIQNPADGVSLRRILNVPHRGIGKTSLEKIDKIQLEMQNATFFDALKRVALDPALLGGAAAKKIPPFVQLIERLSETRLKMKLNDFYQYLLDETGYLQELRQENTDEALARVDNLQEFSNILIEFEQAHPEMKENALERFLEEASLASDVDQLKDQLESVKLMTLHSSKGLEFPFVFVVGLEDGLFPSVRPWEQTEPEEIEEERRLCYVGMTRAKKQLYLTNASLRKIWGQITPQDPSRFLDEIPEEFVETKNFSFQSQPPTQIHSYPGNTRPAPTFTGRSFSPVPSREPPKTSGFRNVLIGHHLNHPEYGRGRILESEGNGESQKITVEFSGKLQRKFLLKYVNAYVE